MAEPPDLLSTPLSAEQQQLIGLLASTYRAQRSWPPWQFIEQTLEVMGIVDASAVLASLPHVGTEHLVNVPSYGLTWARRALGSTLQADDRVGLTVVGFYRSGARPYVDIFLHVLSMATRKLSDFVPSPRQAVTLELASAEVYGTMTNRQKELLASQELYTILEHEPAMWTGGHSITQQGEWRWEIARPIRRYAGVRSIYDYVREITALIEESAQQVAQTVSFANPVHADAAGAFVAWSEVEVAPIVPQQLNAEVPLLGSGIDSELWDYVRPLVVEHRWEQVAREAAAFVETRAREWPQSDGNVLNLMSEIFKADKRKGSLSQDTRPADPASEGWHLFARGFFMAVRNHVMHNSVGTEEQFQYGLGALGAASLLIRQIRRATEDRLTRPDSGTAMPSSSTVRSGHRGRCVDPCGV